jgi:acyl-CoA reductase-like NAD-dependent aldehyde dehydrogenase
MLKVINPATGELIQELQVDTETSLRKKHDQAQEAQLEWKSTRFDRRIQIIQRFSDLLKENLENLARTLTQEVGKPISQSRNEILGTLSRINFFLSKAEGVTSEAIVFKSESLEEKMTHEPLGTIANISAWNYPYFVGSNVFIPALLTGNAVLYKPSEFASLTGLAIERLFNSAGLPQGVFTALIGNGRIGSELLKLPINGIFFTGSYATGTKILQSTATRMIRTQLELGGKDPVYITDDVDVDLVAAQVADGAFYNTGQSCCSVERIYIQENIYNAFIEHFMDTVKSFSIGDPLVEQTYIGPVTRKEHLETLELQVSDAVEKGAKLLCGGRKREGRGYFFEPTVLVEVNHTMQVMREETFGPIIGIQKVKGDVEAAHWMNETDYGLTASVYSRNERRAMEILSQMNTGTVYWNCCDRVTPQLPWSGRKNSGIGLTLSTYGIQAFTQPKAWHLKNSK